MSPRPEASAPAGISRREAIRRAALAAGVIVSAEWLSIVDGAPPAALAQGARLAPAHAAIAGAVADRILPRTDTPGAADVGVPAFLDLLYAEFMTPAEQKTLTSGLDAVEKAAQSARGASFVSLPVDRQDDVLRRIAAAEEAQEGGFFRLIRSATILGYFTSEPVGRNVLHYDPVPGAYDGCVPIDQVGRRNWTT
jgi:hypothetical protein